MFKGGYRPIADARARGVNDSKRLIAAVQIWQLSGG